MSENEIFFSKKVFFQEINGNNGNGFLKEQNDGKIWQKFDKIYLVNFLKCQQNSQTLTGRRIWETERERERERETACSSRSL